MLATPRFRQDSGFDPMEHRGRSRAIPQAAIFRKYSQHQQQLYSPIQRSRSVSLVTPRSQSPDSASVSPQSTIEPITPPEYALDYYDSAPTPPQSIEDKIQEAYALDNIHLAKVLFLKLKGIEVVDDNDPRLDEVQDEDFPFGRLELDEEDERALKESQRQQQDRQLDQQRQDRLTACERFWQQSLTQYREHRLALIRQKEAAALAIEQEKRIQAEREEQAKYSLNPRGLLSYKSLGQSRWSHSSSPPDSGFVFEYSIMRPSSPPAPSFRRMSGSAKTRSEFLFQSSSSNSIPFADVVTSMRGPLFPFQLDQDVIHPDRRKRISRVRDDLLDVLLDTVRWEDGERKRVKGKDREQPFTWSSTKTLCAACTSSSKSSTLVSRSTSWLNFGGRRAKLTSSASPPDSPLTRTVPLIGPSMPSTSSNPPLKPKHSCCRSSSAPVLLEDSPLYTHSSRPRSVSPTKKTSPNPSFIASKLVKRVGDSVASLLDIASQFQAAYMRATVFSVNLQTEIIYSRDSSRSRSRSLSSLDDDEPKLRPVGYRVKSDDITSFIGCAERRNETETGPLIPMLSSAQRHATLTSPSTSSARITPSPLRPREPPTCLQYRIRPVANPVLLRLKALQNVCCVGNLEWQGRAKAGALGFGKERLMGVAFEGIGRSGLSWEVTPLFG